MADALKEIRTLYLPITNRMLYRYASLQGKLELGLIMPVNRKFDHILSPH
jgi:hypothetical protein